MAPKTKLDTRAAEYVKEHMPKIGVGTYQVGSESVLRETIDAAFECGYRFIDTAQIYRNEATIGKILPALLEKHSLKRDDIFITTKVSPANQGKKKAYDSVIKSLSALNVEYLDLVLIHWPGTQKLKPSHPDNARLRTETYADLEQLLDEGKIRALGVSNYEICHLEELLNACRYLPAANQCECHPHFPNRELADYCKEKGIHFQAYSSLGGPDHVASLLKDPRVKKAAAAHGVSEAIVLLAWGLQQGFSILPRTEKASRIRENYAALKCTLTDAEMAALSCIGKVEKVCWDPTTVT